MRIFDTGRVQNKLLDRIERKEKKEAFQRDRFFQFKLPDIQSQLSQALLIEKIVETENPGALSELLLKGLKKAQKSNEFDFKYFIAPIRGITPRGNPISLYITQYILEVIIEDPSIVDVYGTDLEIYHVVNKTITKINNKFERTEKEIIEQLANNKNLVPGSREYDIALDQAFRKKVGEPQQNQPSPTPQT